MATEKLDGSCCAIINGEFYKRYDAKRGKTPPEEAIPCCEPDAITSHWPHWVKVNPEDKGDVLVRHGATVLEELYKPFQHWSEKVRSIFCPIFTWQMQTVS